MRWILSIFAIAVLCSCNISANKTIPTVHAAMPKPWQMVHYEEEFLPYNGDPIDVTLITNKKDLVGLLKWKGVDTGYHQVFDMERENLVVTYRPENDGSKRYSLWMQPQSSTLYVKKEDLEGYGYKGKHTPSYLYFYRIPKNTENYTVMEQETHR